ncbi:MAG: hypothetical protein HC915_17235 [Anaerolineae bacterium]|nr:hypothetical protein [Anaerolineae bacterium]
MNLTNYDKAWEYAERLYALANAYADVTYQIRGALLRAHVLMLAPRDHNRDVQSYIREAYELVARSQRLMERPAIHALETEYLKRRARQAD